MKNCLLALGSFAVASALSAAPADLVGTWGFTIPADFDDIGEKVVHMDVKKDASGKYSAYMLWRWGSPETVEEIKVDGNRFTLKHPYGADVAGEWDGDDIYIHYTFMLGGKLKDSRKILPAGSKGLKGHRNPPLEAEKVDTRAAKFGAPINLLKDGKAGFEIIAGKGKDCWKFADGMLSNDVGKDEKGRWKGGGLNIRTKRADFRDFKLEYDVRVPKDANSGVYLRGRYEIQTADTTKQKKPDRHSMGAYYGRVAPCAYAEKAPDEWQHVCLTLYRGHLTVWLNGVEIIRNAPLTGVTGGALDAEEQNPGPIYIQGDHSNADYRNMVLWPVAE